MMRESMPERTSPHISYTKQYTHYHRVMADLVLKYTPSGGRVLDIGCGLGHVLRLIHDSDLSVELVGADPDRHCLEATQSRCPAVRTIRIRENYLDLDALGGPYSTCIMSHSLEHSLRPAETVRGVLDLLQEGGHLVLAVPNPARPTVLLSNALKKHYVNRGHVYSWDRSHWINFLERILGLEVVEYASDEVRLFSNRVIRRVPVLKRLEIALSKPLPWWSFSNIAVVRRSVTETAAADDVSAGQPQST
jgi:2-polyprenyl-3-methyl-5-hydroxy-6-metoxy-1,4-benzoquinol methylase